MVLPCMNKAILKSTYSHFHCAHETFSNQPRIFVGYKHLQPLYLSAVTINCPKDTELPAHLLVIPDMSDTVRALK